jgi:hypothetical protein
MFAESLVLTLILLDPSIVIQDGHTNPPIMQLKVGTMPQPFESVNLIAEKVVNIELTVLIV